MEVIARAATITWVVMDFDQAVALPSFGQEGIDLSKSHGYAARPGGGPIKQSNSPQPRWRISICRLLQLALVEAYGYQPHPREIR